jgi:hypothetical protein
VVKMVEVVSASCDIRELEGLGREVLKFSRESKPQFGIRVGVEKNNSCHSRLLAHRANSTALRTFWPKTVGLLL